MPTLIEAKNKVRTLAQEALTAVDNPRLDNARKKAVLDRLEPEIKHWTDEVAVLERFEESKKNMFGGMGLGALDGMSGAVGSMLDEGDAKRYNAPPLRLVTEDLKQMHESATRHKNFAAKAAIGAVDVPQSVIPAQGVTVAADREPNRILDLIPTTGTTSPVIEYRAAIGTTNAAATAQGAPKPQSNLSYLPKEARAVKIAHWLEVEDEVLADYPAFRAALNDDMAGGVVDGENTELLLGDGSIIIAPQGNGVDRHMIGLLNTTGIITRVHRAGDGSAVDDTQLDTLELAATDLRTGARFAEPDAIALHPLTYSRIRRSKSAGSGEYLVGDPTEQGPAHLWGVPCALTTSMPVGEAMVANLAKAAAAYVRDGLRVESANQGTQQFTENKTLVRGEERIILTVPRPACIVRVTGLAA